MIYDPFAGVFKSQTREGNSLEFTESDSFLSWINENRREAGSSAFSTKTVGGDMES